MNYMHRNTAITFFVYGLIFGMFVGVAACVPDTTPQHITTIGTQ